MGKYLEVVMPLIFLFYSLYAVYKKIKRKKGIMQTKQQLRNRLPDYRQRVPLILILENDREGCFADYTAVYGYPNYLFRTDSRQKWTREETLDCFCIFGGEDKCFQFSESYSERQKMNERLRKRFIELADEKNITKWRFFRQIKFFDIWFANQERELIHIAFTDEIQAFVMAIMKRMGDYEKIVPLCAVGHADEEISHIHFLYYVKTEYKKVQNIAGYLVFTIQGMKGQHVSFVCGEVLDADGKVDMSGIQETRPAKGWGQVNLIKKLLTNQVSGELSMTPKQEIHFICSGDVDEYKTSFAIFGFRYVQVEGIHSNEIHSIKSIAIYSDMEQTGTFHCSNEGVNKLVQNTMWSMKGNFLDIPTDCPTRERLGWTGDAQIFFETGAYLMDTAAFFRKWLQDMEDSQYKNGLIPAVIPLEGVEMMYKSTGSSVGWADAIYLIPYRYYKCYGDIDILRRYWPMMKCYAEYVLSNLGLRDKKEGKANPFNDFTYEKGIHLGEWLEPEEFRDPVYGTKAKHPEECTAYLYYTMTTLAEIAEVTGDKKEQLRYLEIAKGAKKAYEYLVVKQGGLNTNRQAKLLRPIRLGVLNEEDEQTAVNQLVNAIKEYRYRVGTGFLSTPFILPVLTENGHVDVAYKILENTEKPGWLAEVHDGATTIWENWEGNLSQNHYSPGDVCQWLFDSVAGIRIEGKNHFVIQPVPGGTLVNAEASYQSPYGKVISRWNREKDSYEFFITIPANTSATIRLMDGTEKEVEAGDYCYHLALNQE